MNCFLVYITCSGASEAKKIAHALVEEKLAACANIFPSVVSVYEWEGDIQEEQESVLILKTIEDNLDQIQKRVKKLHSHSVPCILEFPIQSGNEEFLQWISS